MEPVTNFPLRWESTGDQWWYASPIDWAAANGSYALVRELLYLDANLLIKLTSLRRIRRLETVWDDEAQFDEVAKRRADVALKLFQECAAEDGKNVGSGSCKNSLIRAGYGGWLMYTAASAGDVAFVKELLNVDPFLVFGEGEYGVTDVFYAAARSRNGEVFRLLVNSAISLRGVSHVGGDEFGEFPDSVLKSEMINRALHAAARGGFLEMVKEILSNGGDVLSYRDHQGSAVLHSAASKGQVEVVKDLVASFGLDPISKDNQGNTALHVAAYRGHLAVLDALLLIAPSSAYVTNRNGDTFLHMAVAGFKTPGFHRIDKQVELLKSLVSGGAVDNMREIVNVRNMDGRTALHVALAENIPSEVVELLMAVPSIDLNCRDNNGMTPLDLLRKRARTADSEFLMRRFVSAGGRSSFVDDRALKNDWVSKLKMHGTGNSPGTSFRIPDAEIFLYTTNESGFSDGGTGYEIDEFSRPSSVGSIYAASKTYSPGLEKKPSSRNNAAARLKMLFQRAMKKENKQATKLSGDDDSTELYKIHGKSAQSHVPLRQKYSKSSSHPTNNKKNFPADGTFLSSASAKKNFVAGLLQSVIPHETMLPNSSSGSVSRSSSISSEDNQKATELMSGRDKTSHINQKGCANNRLINQYFCFGSHSIAVENIIRASRPPIKNHRRAISTAN
ncbi:unnamed protein product [Rhodiola kirilowii]